LVLYVKNDNNSNHSLKIYPEDITYIFNLINKNIISAKGVQTEEIFKESINNENNIGIFSKNSFIYNPLFPYIDINSKQLQNYNIDSPYTDFIKDSEVNYIGYSEYLKLDDFNYILKYKI
jgi:hypothetical protein